MKETESYFGSHDIFICHECLEEPISWQNKVIFPKKCVLAWQQKAITYCSSLNIDLLLFCQSDSADGKLNTKLAKISIVQTVLSTGAAGIGLVYASGIAEGSMNFMGSTVGFM